MTKNKRRVIIFVRVIIIFIIGSCGKVKNHGNLTDSVSIFVDTVLNPVQSALSIDTISEKEFRDLFRFREASYYNLYKERDLMSLLQESKDFWLNKRIVVNNKVKSIDIWGYPLSYKALNDSIIRLTTITEGEAENKIIAITLNKKYERIGTETLTSFGGDSGEFWRTYGEFINDSTFMRTNVSYNSDDTISTKKLYNRWIRFKPNGQMEELEKPK